MRGNDLAPDPELAQRLAQALSPWFVANQRDLEWRRTRDPYAIWVSEIMLQQTRVDTVRAYYRAFLGRFPDVGALAAADEESVLQAWSGLGYYRRARLLHRGARYVVEELAGEVPAPGGGRGATPGVGRNPAGATASTPHDRPVPLVDGNVARVLSRIRAITDPRLQGADAEAHWRWAEAILRAGSPRILAQALMELGATVCTPQRPSCDACPVAAMCQARAQGLSQTIPAPKVKAAAPEDQLWAVAIVRKGKILVERRPSEGLLAGLWCLPLIARAGAKPRPAAIKAATGVAVRQVAEAPGSEEPVTHVFPPGVWKLWPLPRAGAGRGARARRDDVDRRR
ncbi:MAG: A/G-specific adenine glycosylase [Myxococcales bacterium]|nr:A/G-specific adenine glycosylase [Myxococcales bacterium]